MIAAKLLTDKLGLYKGSRVFVMILSNHVVSVFSLDNKRLGLATFDDVEVY